MQLKSASTQLSATTACARRRRDTEEKVVIGNDDIGIKPDPPKPYGKKKLISENVELKLTLHLHF